MHLSFFPLPFYLPLSPLCSFWITEFGFNHCVSLQLFVSRQPSDQFSLPFIRFPWLFLLSPKEKADDGASALITHWFTLGDWVSIAVSAWLKGTGFIRLLLSATACNRICQSKWNKSRSPSGCYMHTYPWNTSGDVSNRAKVRIGLMANQCHVKKPIDPIGYARLTHTYLHT